MVPNCNFCRFISALPCSPPTVPANTTICNNKTEYEKGDSLQFTCLDGYELVSGDLEHTCEGNNNWQGQSRVCQGGFEWVWVGQGVTWNILVVETITGGARALCAKVGTSWPGGDLEHTCGGNNNWRGQSPVCQGGYELARGWLGTYLWWKQ